MKEHYKVGTKVKLAHMGERVFEITSVYHQRTFVLGDNTEETIYTLMSDGMRITSVHVNVIPLGTKEEDQSVDELLDAYNQYKTAYQVFDDPVYLEKMANIESVLASKSKKDN